MWWSAVGIPLPDTQSSGAAWTAMTFAPIFSGSIPISRHPQTGDRGGQRPAVGLDW